MELLGRTPISNAFFASTSLTSLVARKPLLIAGRVLGYKPASSHMRNPKGSRPNSSQSRPSAPDEVALR